MQRFRARCGQLGICIGGERPVWNHGPDIICCTSMRNLKPPPVRSNPQRKVHINKDLFSGTHVFVRNDRVRKPLQYTYNGPYRVLDRAEKYFTLDCDGRKETVSLDRLK